MGTLPKTRQSKKVTLPIKKRVVFLVGPTASGKSDVALALAPKINAEIISCDSMYIYKGMDIGTAKPTAEDRKKIPHHLLDVVSPRSQFSVFQYRQLALKAMDSIFKKGKTVLFVGGTGLYVKAILDGISSQPGETSSIREKLWREADENGVQNIYQKLQAVDPLRASQIHPNDTKRIIRALEVFEATKRPLSDWEIETEGLDPNVYSISVYGLLWDREALYRRVEERVDRMMASGFLEEVKRLKRKGFSLTAREAIGYKELIQLLEGKMTLELAIEEIKKRTRHLVKKQMTWFRREARLKWIAVSSNKKFISEVVKTIVVDVKKLEKLEKSKG